MKARVDQGGQVDMFEVLAHHGPTRLAGQVVGQFLDNKVGHGELHLLSEQCMIVKSLISIENLEILPMKSRTQVFRQILELKIKLHYE